ncbi:major facilitator superfamily multidrug-resistance, DHA1 sub-family [Crassisporium funariophilum]|nr:major facilitator superfamily multidrug-resistance, DHA1 sub-family [Crassisporium funariophilum]
MRSEEARRLLDDDESTLEARASGTDSACSLKPTPLPKVQLGILCLLRILDPMNFSQIFPYVNQFMIDLHVTNDLSKIGFYSGLESAFACSQLLSIYPWGIFSDRFGRRPVVLVGVAGLAITTILFGLSSTFNTVMLSRGLAGLFSGNVAVIPSILCEITDQTNQAFAFPFFGFWWPVGAIIGPLIGGFFSNPATRYPRYFDYDFLRVYPYFLPCLLVSSFSFLAFVTSWFLLEETLSSKVEKPKTAPRSYGATTQAEGHVAVPISHNLSQLLAMPIIRALCTSGCALSFISTSFDVIFVLFCFSPVSAGGLAFSTSEIGFALSVAGGIAGLLQVFFMPMVLRRVDHAAMYHFCMKIWPYTFLALPLLNIIARHGVVAGKDQLEVRVTFILWIGIFLVLCMARVAFLAYSVNMLLMKRYAPNSSSIGSTTGLVQFSICLSRAFSPAFASSTFAFSNKMTFLHGYSWVLVMAMLGFLGCLFSRNIIRESSK